MVFSSLLFLYLFLPLNLIFYWLMPDLRRKNRVMLVFSLLFYAWAGPAYLLLLVGMTFVDWCVTLAMSEKRTLPSGRTATGGRRARARKRWLVLGCTVNLILLCVFKYLSFLLGNLNHLFGVPRAVPTIALPIGISFYTFQLLSYMVDVYRGKVSPQRSFPTLLLYVSMFHQCIAGPIIRYEHVERELTRRRVTASELSAGIRRFTVGLAKKALLANPCGSFADTFLATAGAQNLYSTLVSKPVLSVWLGMLAYTLQIYLDFSAYSDMALGLGQMIGFHYQENFDYPYLSRSITDFWRRWHISLGSFFRDYLYIPLGGNRCSRNRHLFNLLVVWALTGLWHGASWNFLFWGLYYFLFLAAEKYLYPRWIDRASRPLTRLYTILIVSFGWMIFRFKTPAQVFAVVRGLFGLNGSGFTSYETNVTLQSSFLFFLVAIMACTPVIKALSEWLRIRRFTSVPARLVLRVTDFACPILLLLLSTAALVGDSYNPFLYFRF